MSVKSLRNKGGEFGAGAKSDPPKIDLGRPPAGVGTVAPRQFPRKPGVGGSRCGSEIPLAVVPELSRRDSSKGGCRQGGRAGVKISYNFAKIHLTPLDYL